MASGYHGVIASEKPPAATINDFWSKQVVMVFADTTDRDTQLSGVLREGMHCYIVNLNVDQVYTGSAWSTIGPLHGALTTQTPTLTQSGAVTKTGTWHYSRVGRQITAYCTLAVTGAGTATNQISVSLPVTAAASGSDVGTGYVIDASANSGSGAMYRGIAVLGSTTIVVLYDNTDSGIKIPANLIVGSGSATMQTALASGDTVAFQIQYEAAADA